MSRLIFQCIISIKCGFELVNQTGKYLTYAPEIGRSLEKMLDEQYMAYGLLG